ncbi:PREDICTED: IQ domain-containing protein D [Apaloderma vittatum]|uniref:IQ domain-containing protein D n=1 Tax=Apaloderma vittatum TaxID=57397 RepID=UPI0005213DFD|nr:PREDICTED: IQ domain-containing protein D [Apaloderma vittatum]
MAAPEMAAILLDATKMLDPCLLKPDRIKAKRIVSVLDETLAKLEMSSLIPRIISSLDRFAETLGPEITDSLIEHRKLSNEMEHLLASSKEGDMGRAEEQRGCLCLLEQRLKRSLRTVLRLLLANPSLCQALKYKAWVKESPAEAFIKAFAEFRNFMLERLLTSPMEKEEKMRFTQDVSLQVQKNTEALTALQAELAAAIQTREEEIHKKDNAIKDLKTSMQDLAKDRAAGIQQIEQEREKRQEEARRDSQARCAGLQRDIQELEAQLGALVAEHRASELALRKRKRRVEMEIVNWIQKYDTDMEEKQAEYDEVRAAYAEEKAQLALLTEKRAVLLQECSQIEEERRTRQKKEEEALKELTTMTLAATRIQAFWRGYLVRSLLKSKKKKKKKKVKGRKGKKTKK